MTEKFDFVIIGAGVTGAWIAFELSKYRARVALVDRSNDLCTGASKANSAIVHAGYDPAPGTLKARFNVRGNEIIREVHEKMDIPFKNTSSFVVAFDDEGMEKIKALYERGLKNGVPGLRLISGEEAKCAEPSLSDEVKGALYAPTAGICSPFELTAAPAQIAAENGVRFIRNFRVEGARITEDGAVITAADGRELAAKTVINAAGSHADEVAALFGDTSFCILPRVGEYSILDKSVGDTVGRVIFQPPTSRGKGILVAPTVDCNLLVGPTSDPVDDADDVATTAAGQAKVFEGARRSVPVVSERDVITSFSGVRPSTEGGDFIIGFSGSCPCLFNAAGIDSPGLTSAPAIAEYAIELITRRCDLEKKSDFADSRRVVRVERMNDGELGELIAKNSAYGRIICRCEGVTEGEIIASIAGETGARDMDGVKRRVRAGMGRCQGGFCGPRVIEILSRELGIAPEEVTKSGGKSYMLLKDEDRA